MWQSVLFSSCLWDVHSEGSGVGTGCADAYTLALVQEPRSDSTHTFLDTEKDVLKAMSRGTLSLNQASWFLSPHISAAASLIPFVSPQPCPSPSPGFHVQAEEVPSQPPCTPPHLLFPLTKHCLLPSQK